MASMLDRAGIFDRLLANPRVAESSMLDVLRGMIPIFGPFIARRAIKNRQDKLDNEWLSENAMFSDPSTLDPLGQRVQQRMLARSGGNISEPGFRAATAFSQAAQEDVTGNPGNIGIEAAAKIFRRNPDEAARLTQLVHKDFPTPWKTTESGANAENFQFPDGRVVTLVDPNAKVAALNAGALQVGIESPEHPYQIVSGRDIGANGDTANDAFKMRRDSQGRIVEVSKLDNAPKVSVGAPDLAGFAAAIKGNPEFTQQYNQYRESLNGSVDAIDDIRELKGILKPGVMGTSGWITSVAGKVENTTDFILGLSRNVNSNGQSEASVVSKQLSKLNSIAKRLPISDQALAQSIMVRLAYSIARANNMGSASGGRGITDNDMEYAVQQLGATSTVEGMQKVLDATEARTKKKLKLAKEDFSVILRGMKDSSGNPMSMPPEWEERYNSVMSTSEPPPIIIDSPEDAALIEKYLPK